MFPCSIDGTTTDAVGAGYYSYNLAYVRVGPPKPLPERFIGHAALAFAQHVDLTL